jgi:hypothetical protein
VVDVAALFLQPEKHQLLNACIEQVIQHGEVDVFQAVKTVRRHRPQLVENIVSIIWKRRLCTEYILNIVY